MNFPLQYNLYLVKGLQVENYTAIFVRPISSSYDSSNVWPLVGKQITIGIVEVGFYDICFREYNWKGSLV